MGNRASAIAVEPSIDDLPRLGPTARFAVTSRRCHLRARTARARGFHVRSTTGGHSLLARACLLAAIVMPGSACVGTGEGLRSASMGHEDRGSRSSSPPAEQMIDELDRIMTSYGTISVKTPDVWGQDRLAKFRSEYEAQMADWLKVGFKSEINASVQRSETESTIIQVGTERAAKSASTAPASTTTALAADSTLLHSFDQERAALDAGAAASKATAATIRPHRWSQRRARRALELSQPPQPAAADQRRRRPGRQTGIWALPRPDPGDALAGSAGAAGEKGRSSPSRRSRS